MSIYFKKSFDFVRLVSSVNAIKILCFDLFPLVFLLLHSSSPRARLPR